MQLVWWLFAGWVVYFALRGYLKGIWLSLIGLTGLVIAYLTCFIWWREAGSALKPLGLNTVVATVLGVVLMFVVVYLLVTTLPKVALIKHLEKKGPVTRYTGAALGAVTGVISGLVILWSLSFLGAAWQVSKQNGNGGEPAAPFVPPKLGSLAGELVGGLTQAGGRSLGADELRTRVMGAMVARPDAFVRSFASLTDSGEINRFFADPVARHHMAKQDYASLRQTRAFKELAEQPGMQQLTELAVAKQTDEPEHVEKMLARDITFVWRRLEYLRNDPEMQAILQDAEVVALAQEENPLVLLANPKMQKIIEKVLSDDPAMEDYNFTQHTDPTQTSDPAVESIEPQIIYRWVDDRGRVQYTDRENIPEDKLDSATVFSK